MCHLIRRIRLKDAELWEARFMDYSFPCYISIVDMKRKAVKKDNELASEEELNERDNYIEINVVSDRDIKNSGIDMEGFISSVDALVEHMSLANCHIFYKFTEVKTNLDKASLHKDEELYGSKEEQLVDFVEESVKKKAITFIENAINLAHQVSDTYFCQG